MPERKRSWHASSHVGVFIGAGWCVYGLSLLPWGVAVPLGVLFSVALVMLLRALHRKVFVPVHATARPPHRPLWIFFLLNFAAEIAMLNLAALLCSRPGREMYLIPAISVAVGLHFFPMARIFRVRVYVWCGLGFIALALLAGVAAYYQLASAPVLHSAESLGNAVVLWLSVYSVLGRSRNMTAPSLIEAGAK